MAETAEEGLASSENEVRKMSTFSLFKLLLLPI